ncbi:MAG: hypothetical protein LBI14_11730 [Treponema sp.]|nr:hypothetical protein [Treponema sp.]
MNGIKKRKVGFFSFPTPYSLLPIPYILIIAGMTSCLGVNADITLNADNSGTISLEYRISQAFDSLGRLDGNEARPPLPVGRMDFERTVERIPGMRLLSYVSRDSGSDRIVTARLEFSTIDDLLQFLDASGQRADYVPGQKKISFILNPGNNASTSEFNALISQISQGYNIAISMSFPSEGTVNVLDAEGRASIARATVQPRGRKVSASLPLETVLSDEKGITLEFRW